MPSSQNVDQEIGQAKAKCSWAYFNTMLYLQVGIPESIQHSGSECGGRGDGQQERHGEQRVQQSSKDIPAPAQILPHGYHVTPAQWLDSSAMAGVF